MANTAIFAKIDPAVILVQQDNVFNPTPIYITGSYMTAVAEQYTLGTDKVNFRVTYGMCSFDESDNVVGFKPIHAENVTLLEQDIESWGQDDSVVLYTIASKQNLSILSVVSGSADMSF